MRELNLYCVYDKRAETIVGPIDRATSSVPIIRAVKDSLTDPQSIIGKNPEDFQVICIGRLDDTTGRITDTECMLITEVLALKQAQQ